MICVGIDVAKDKHDCFILNSEGVVLADVFTISNNLDGFNTLLYKLRACSTPQDSMKVGLEATGHYSYNLLGFLPDNGLATYVLNPLRTNLYRKSLSLRKTKTDRVDARTIAAMLLSDAGLNEVKKGHRETALKALHNGGTAPFGYDVVNQRYVINELEAGYVRKLFNAAVNREGYTAILAEMSATGITGKRGKPIKYTQVYEMLRNEKYTETYVYTPQEEERREDRRSKPNAIRIENALPQIVSKAQFMEVQRIMTERRQAGNRVPDGPILGIV